MNRSGEVSTMEKGAGQSSPNPYIGPRHFRSDDVWIDKESGEGRRLFFGREKEARRLVPYIIAEKLVLFYAQSGAGKSSLIHARIVPDLEERNFIVLLGRVSRSIPDEEREVRQEIQSTNIYTHNLLLSLEQQAPVQALRSHQPPGGKPLQETTLAEYCSDLIAQQARQSGALADVKASQADNAPPIIKGARPLAIIIDQFEELFTAYPWAWPQRDAFFEQLCEAMEQNPYLWVVLTLREDHLASLDPYAHFVPGEMRARFYMQRMNEKTALEAVSRPAALFGHPFEEEEKVAGTLVDCLRMVNVETHSGDPWPFVIGQYIEPVELQIVCYRLWEQVHAKLEDGEKITWKSLGIVTDDIDLKTSAGQAVLVKRVHHEYVDKALEKFYKDGLGKAAGRSGVEVEKACQWVSKYLITPTYTRRRFFPNKASEEEAQAEAFFRQMQVEQIINQFRSFSGEYGYELIHDRLIEPIQRIHLEIEKESLTEWKRKAWEWQQGGRKDDELLMSDEKMIRDAEKELAEKERVVPDYQTDFVESSRARANALEVSRSRRQRILLIIIAIIFFLLFLFALKQSIQAENSRQAAETNKQDAILQKETAQVAAEDALRQKLIALDSQKVAVAKAATAVAAQAAADQASMREAAQRQVAQTAEAEAVVGQKLAQASELSSLSDYFRNSQFDLSLLLGIEAVKRSPGWESRKSLFEGLQYGRTSQARNADWLPLEDCIGSAMAYSEDGSYIAIGCDGSKVRLLNAQTLKEARPIPESFFYNQPVARITAFAFDSTSTLLAIGSAGGNLWLWDIPGKTITPVTGVVDRYGPWAPVQSLAFQPNGALLAIATEVIQGRGQMILYNYKLKQEVSRTDCGPSNCAALAWSQDGNKLAFGNARGDITISSSSLNGLRSMEYNGRLTGLAWFTDSVTLASGGHTGIKTWNTGTSELINEAASGYYLTSLALSKDDSILVTGTNGDDKPIIIWNAKTLIPYNAETNDQKRTIITVVSNPTKNAFATLGYDNKLILWEFEPQAPLWRQLETGDNKSIDAFQTIDRATNGFARKISSVWYEVKANDNPPAQCHFLGDVTSVALQKRGSQIVLAAGGRDGVVRFCDASTGKVLPESFQVSNGWINALAISADAKLLAAAACRKDNRQCDTLVVWNLITNQLVQQTQAPDLPDEKGISVLTFSPDDQSMLLGAKDGRVFFLDLQAEDQAKGMVPMVTEGLGIAENNQEVTSLLYGGPDENLLVAGFVDGRIAMWEEKSRNPIGEFNDQKIGPVSGLGFRQENGSTVLLSTTRQGKMFAWVIEVGEWIRYACNIAQRNLSPAEAERYIHDTKTYTKSCPDYP